MGFDENEWGAPYDEYTVGYGRPPKHSRFRKGRSGNPGGRARGAKNSATLLKRALLELVTVRLDGRSLKASKLRVMVTQLVGKAMRGDYASMRLLFRYVGLDRQLNNASKHGGLSNEAEALIRRALLGRDEPEAPGQPGRSKSPASLNPIAKPKLRANHRDGYRVGYRQPPLHSRFQKGQSGNPAGRARAPRSFRLLALRLLEEKVPITRNGQQRIVSRLEIIFEQIVNKAAMGDSKFTALLLEYAPMLDVTVRRHRFSKNAVERIRKRLISEISNVNPDA